MQQRSSSATLKIVLPVVWGLTSLVSHAHPGDEYGLYVVSSVLGFWVALVPRIDNIVAAPYAVAVGGALVVWGIASGLARLRVRVG